MPIEHQPVTLAEINLKIQAARTCYPAAWQQMINEWQKPGPDSAWLMYSANYLFRTAGMRWAMDPFTLPTRLNLTPISSLENDLSQLELVVLTHAHADHLDLKLITRVCRQPLTWVIPEFMLDRVKAVAQIPDERIIIPIPGTPIHFGELKLIPFNGQHIRGTQSIPEMAYLTEFSGKRWLFPADTRVYDNSKLPSLPPLDGVFAHLWLGKGCADRFPPPLLGEFCAFFAGLQPARMVITHLDELGRQPEDFWSDSHFAAVQEQMNVLAPEVITQMAKYCEQVDL